MDPRSAPHRTELAPAAPTVAAPRPDPAIPAPSRSDATPGDDPRQGRRLLGWALLLTVVFHGALLAYGSFERTYDALIHIFFASHYQQSWFDPWEPRWYTGFFTIAYPPLSHYLTAVAGWLVGLKPGFALVQLGALLTLVIGMYRFARLFFPARAAGYAALALVLSSSIAETVHVFGQLPTTLSLSLLLNAIPFIWRYLERGRWWDLARAIAWTAATTSAHHVTTLFGSVFFTGPVVVMLLLQALRMPRPGEPRGDGWRRRLARRAYRLAPRTWRSGVFGVLAIATLLITVLPYWWWSRSDPISQVTIPHASREDFLTNGAAGLVFWLIPWASSLWALPYAVYRGLSWRWPAVASLLFLALLGTGGTTPIPRALLRGAFDILTLDRFTFWATIWIVPFVGAAVDSLLHGRARAWLDANFGRRVRLGLLTGALATAVAGVVLIGTLTRYRSFQPDPIDVAPIVTFIEKDEHWRYRYLTLGFGDQMAWLGANTRATTPDGNYHSARRLPELTTTPIERLEGAKYTGVPGLGSLESFLGMPERFHLKFVFSNDAFYDPLLHYSGWHRLGRLENGIQVWEREDIPPLPERLPRRPLEPALRLLWGVIPTVAPILALLTLLLPRGPTPLLPWQRRRPWRGWLALLREDALPAEVPGGWQAWRRRLRPPERVPNFRRRGLAARWLRTLGLAALLALPATLVLRGLALPPSTVESTLLGYWDDIDVKRFADAYDWLEPTGGLTLERFLLDLSVVGGLRSGYAKLDALRVEEVRYAHPDRATAPRPGDRAAATVQLDWLTSLEAVTETRRHELVYTARGWRIEAAPALTPRSPERFAAQPEVARYAAPRRLTTATTGAHDVLDRPPIRVLEARLVRYDAPVQAFDPSGAPVADAGSAPRLAIVGRVRNDGARPGDLTVTGVLRAADGRELARSNAQQLLVHKLLPGESSPFRIDFAGVRAPDDPSEVAAIEVYAKAVVTGRDLARPLAAWTDLLPADPATGAGARLGGELVNVGTAEATVPQLLLALYDDDGLAWLSDRYPLEAVAPRGRLPFTVPLELPPGYTPLGLALPPDPDAAPFAPPAVAPLVPSEPAGPSALRGYRLTVQSFQREAK